MKTNKSLSKRFKITKSGKVLGRKPGGNHFNAKQPRSRQLAGNRAVSFAMTTRAKRRLLSGV